MPYACSPSDARVRPSATCRAFLLAVSTGFAVPLAAQGDLPGRSLDAGTVLRLHNERRACTHTNSVGDALQLRLEVASGALTEGSAVAARVIFIADSSNTSDSLRLVVMPLSVTYQDSMVPMRARIIEANFLRLRLPARKKSQPPAPRDKPETLVSAVVRALQKADDGIGLCLDRGPVSIELLEPLALPGR